MFTDASQQPRPHTVSVGTKAPSASGAGRKAGRPASSSASGGGGGILPAPKALPGQLFNMEFSPTRHLLGSPDARLRSATSAALAASAATSTASPGAPQDDGIGGGLTTNPAPVSGGTSSGAAKDRLASLEDAFTSIEAIATANAHAKAAGAAAAAGGSGGGGGPNKPTLNPRFLSTEADGDGGGHGGRPGRGTNLLSTTKGGLGATASSLGATLGGGGGPMSTTSGQAAGANVRRQRVEAFLGPVEKANRKIKRENDMLSRVAVLSQENCIDNDAKYDAALKTLRTELEFATVLRQDGSETLTTFNKQFTHVQQQIDHLVATAEHTGQAEHDAVRAAFDKQLDEQKATLGRVRESGKNTTTEWKRRNEELQERLISLLDLTDFAYHKHVALTEESMRLRVEFQAQEGDEQLLQDELSKVNYQHQMLKDKLHALESEAAAMAATGGGGGGSGGEAKVPASNVQFTHPLLTNKSNKPSRPGGSASVVNAKSGGSFSPNSTIGGGDESDHQASYSIHSVDKAGGRGGQPSAEAQSAQAVYKAQILLETEAANLQAVRTAHVAALRQRTELEVFLRQAILLHKQEVQQERVNAIGLLEVGPNGHGAPEGGGGPQMSNTHRASMMRLVGIMADGRPAPTAKAVQFAAADRSSIIEAMLGKKRVLQLMFQDPSDLASSLVDTEPASSMDPKARNLQTSSSKPPASRLRHGSKEYYAAAVGTVSSAEKDEAAELANLYERWKGWTADANQAFNPRANQEDPADKTRGGEGV